MIKETITYTDYNGNERTEELYFNLTESELTELQAFSEKGIQEEMMEAVRNEDLRKLLSFVKELISSAYGVKSEDGRHFRKSDEIRKDFIDSAAYNAFLQDLFKDNAARTQRFITGVMPADLVNRATAAIKNREVDVSDEVRAAFDEHPTIPTAAAPVQNIPEEVPPAPQQVDLDQLAKFQEWQKQQEAVARTEGYVSRPPHESGPGYEARS